MSLIQASGLVVAWRPDVPIDEVIYDPDYHPPVVPPEGDADDIPLERAFSPIDPSKLTDLLDPALDDLFPVAQAQGATLAPDPFEENANPNAKNNDNDHYRYIDPRANNDGGDEGPNNVDVEEEQGAEPTK